MPAVLNIKLGGEALAISGFCWALMAFKLAGLWYIAMPLDGNLPLHQERTFALPLSQTMLQS
jgi:hypothetical protein